MICDYYRSGSRTCLIIEARHFVPDVDCAGCTAECEQPHFRRYADTWGLEPARRAVPLSAHKPWACPQCGETLSAGGMRCEQCGEDWKGRYIGEVWKRIERAMQIPPARSLMLTLLTSTGYAESA